MNADRDDLAALLAEYGIDPEDVLDLAAVVLESDWLRGMKADAWGEGVRQQWAAKERVQFNPYRADRVDAEDPDNTTDRT